MVQPIVEMVYNEINYVWLICIYHVFFILIILANLYLVTETHGTSTGRTGSIRIMDPFFKSAMANENTDLLPLCYLDLKNRMLQIICSYGQD
jgi:hypothetical protein